MPAQRASKGQKNPMEGFLDSVSDANASEIHRLAMRAAGRHGFLGVTHEVRLKRPSSPHRRWSGELGYSGTTARSSANEARFRAPRLPGLRLGRPESVPASSDLAPIA